MIKAGSTSGVLLQPTSDSTKRSETDQGRAKPCEGCWLDRVYCPGAVGRVAGTAGRRYPKPSAHSTQ